MAAPDDTRFTGFQPSLNGPARQSAGVGLAGGDFTPAFLPTALLVGTAGAVVGRLADDTADTTFVLGAGLWPFRFALIRAAGTTAGGLVLVRG